MDELVKISLRRIIAKNEKVEKIENAEDVLTVSFWRQEEMIELLLAILESSMTRKEFYKMINEVYEEVCA